MLSPHVAEESGPSLPRVTFKTRVNRTSAPDGSCYVARWRRGQFERVLILHALTLALLLQTVPLTL